MSEDRPPAVPPAEGEDVREFAVSANVGAELLKGFVFFTCGEAVRPYSCVSCFSGGGTSFMLSYFRTDQSFLLG